MSESSTARDPGYPSRWVLALRVFLFLYFISVFKSLLARDFRIVFHLLCMYTVFTLVLCLLNVWFYFWFYWLSWRWCLKILGALFVAWRLFSSSLSE